MLTPQEIKEKNFEKAMFGGYDMSSVDDFLLPLYEDYSSLYKENSILKGKLKVLVETVEEYRSVDAAMRKALLTAQKMATETIEEANQKSQAILGEAETAANEKLENLRHEIEAEEKRLELAKEQTAKFIAETMSVHNAQIEMLKRLPELMIPKPEKKTTAAQAIKKTAEEIEQNVNSRFAGELNSVSYMVADNPEEPADNPEEDSAGDTKIISAEELAAVKAETDDIISKSVVDFDEEVSGELNESESGMKMKVFEFKIGEKNKIDDDEVTTELPSLDDEDFANPDEDSSPPPRFNFDNLRFGKDYSVK